MKITAIAPWFGSKRTLAPEIVRQLGPHSAYWEPFCGSMAVLLAKKPCSMETVNDLHGDLANLAWVVQDPGAAPQLYDLLMRTLYSEELFARAKEWFAANELPEINGCIPDRAIERAYYYFFISWGGRNGVSGTDRVNYQQAVRWTGKGGSGPTRFRSAVESIPQWHDRLRNVTILRKDAFYLIQKIEDEDDTVIYADPPYLSDTRSADQNGSSNYVHDFNDEQHVRLAEMLRRFSRARVIVSYYASPRLAELYPSWTQVDCSRHKHLHCQNKRGSKRQEAPEVLLINGPAINDSLQSLFT